MAEGGALAGRLGPLIGVGPGRGIALIFPTLGVASLGIVTIAWLYRPMRRVEADLPDIVIEEEPSLAPAM
jgi:hypothetical protein